MYLLEARSGHGGPQQSGTADSLDSSYSVFEVLERWSQVSAVSVSGAKQHGDAMGARHCYRDSQRSRRQLTSLERQVNWEDSFAFSVPAEPVSRTYGGREETVRILQHPGGTVAHRGREHGALGVGAASPPGAVAPA